MRKESYRHLREILANQGPRFYWSQLGPKSQPSIDHCCSAINFHHLMGERGENVPHANLNGCIRIAQGAFDCLGPSLE